MKQIEPPAHLKGDARRIWRRVVAHLAKNGFLLSIDAYAVENFALAVIRQRRIAAELESADLIDADGKPNPLLKVAEATAATVKNLGHVLGLNPMARKSLPVKETTKGDPTWSGVLDK
jgi:P27 family predicted phage terminase small subunit